MPDVPDWSEILPALPAYGYADTAPVRVLMRCAERYSLAMYQPNA